MPAFIGLILFSSLWLLLLGYPLARLCLMQRPRILSALLAPFVSVSVISILGIIFARLHIPWDRWPLTVFSLVWIAIWFAMLGIATYFIDRKISRSSWLPKVALVLVSLFFAVSLLRAFEVPDALSQTYDGVYHLNLVEWFIYNHTASSIGITMLSPTPVFYPAGWHTVASAIALLWGTNAAVATNAFTVCVVALMWPAGIYVGTSLITRGNSELTTVAILASVLFGQFPYLLIHHGVLYPTILSYTYIAPLLGLFILLLRSEEGRHRVALFIFGVALIPGLSLAHPSTVFYLFLIGLPFVPGALYRGIGGVLPRLHWVVKSGVAGVVTIGLLLGVNYLSMQISAIATLRSKNVDWLGLYYNKPVSGIFRVLGGAYGLPLDYSNWRYNIPLQIVIVFGLIYLIKLRSWALPVAYVFSQIFVFVGTVLNGPWRSYIYGLWYGDIIRLASANVILSVVVFSYGVFYLWAVVHKFLRLKASSEDVHSELGTSLLRSQTSRVKLLVVLAVFLAAGTSPHIWANLNQIHRAYDFTDEGKDNWLINTDEYILLKRIPQKVPEGYKVIGNPWNGSAMVQALSERITLYPHVQASRYKDANYIAQHLADAKSDPKVCELVKQYHVGYVLDFGSQYLWGDRMKDHLSLYNGLKFLDYFGVASEVDHEGSKKLLKITACGEIPPEPAPMP